MSERCENVTTGRRARQVVAISIFMISCDAEPEPSTVEGSSPHLRLASMVADVGVGDDIACAVTQAGAVACWGREGAGDAALVDPFVLPRPVRQIGLGLGHRVVLTDDGEVHAWGVIASEPCDSSSSDTGGPAFELAARPVPIGLGEPAVEVSAGADFACARMLDGDVRCWGSNGCGQLGHDEPGRIGDDEPLAAGPAVALAGPATDIAAGALHACAVLDSGLVQCWGRDPLGGRGDGSIAVAAVLDLGVPAVAVVAGQAHTCALLATGAIRCWGDNGHGQLGSGEPTPSDASVKALSDVDVGGASVALVAGANHTCAILEDETIRCWGDNGHGQLGLGHDDDIGDDEVPAEVDPLDFGKHLGVALFAGPVADATFAVLDYGGLRAWGSNDASQLGYGDLTDVGDEPQERPGELPDILIDDPHDDD